MQNMGFLYNFQISQKQANFNLESAIENPVVTAGHLTILEPQDQEICKFFVVQERRSTNFEAPKL